MPGTKNDLKIKKKDKDILTRLVKKGNEKARTLVRCHVLLLSSKGKDAKFIAEALSITSNTVRNIRRRYTDEGLEAAIYEKPRPGAPTIFDGKARAKLTALACSETDSGSSQWSLRLLADKAVELGIVEKISHETIGQILKKRS